MGSAINLFGVALLLVVALFVVDLQFAGGRNAKLAANFVREEMHMNEPAPLRQGNYLVSAQACTTSSECRDKVPMDATPSNYWQAHAGLAECLNHVCVLEVKK
ncbi:MAG: hypothetical protein V1676_03835 [Candidatus Diapherotrites archaeon]